MFRIPMIYLLRSSMENRGIWAGNAQIPPSSHQLRVRFDLLSLVDLLYFNRYYTIRANFLFVSEGTRQTPVSFLSYQISLIYPRSSFFTFYDPSPSPRNPPA